MLNLDEIPQEIMNKADGIKVKRQGRPANLSGIELEILEFMAQQEANEVFSFCRFMPKDKAETMAPYKYALRRIQEEQSIFAKAIKEADIAVFKKDNKCFLWKIDSE